jgi:hypothetical protein
MLQWDCGRFLDQLFDTDLKALNINILICTFWRLLEAFTSMVGPYIFLWLVLESLKLLPGYKTIIENVNFYILRRTISS